MKRSLSQRNEPQQRICVTFSRGEELKYITHLDLMRLWHRALRRAGMPLAYSQGFNPQPRIAIAAPLAVEITSDGELMDIFLQRRVSLDFFAKAVSEQLPQGIGIKGLKELWPGLPSLQSQLRSAEYRVQIESERTPESVENAIRALLELKTLPWEHSRGESKHRYDLRELIIDIWIIAHTPPIYTLGMRLRNDAGGSGRPDQVLLALGFTEPARSIHRTRLIMGTD